jgi:ABC-type antimicrobial peptide transport system permease subunit
MALGAGTSDVRRMMIGHGLRLAAIGVGLGVAGALGVTRLIGSLLYDVTPTDPLSFVAVAAPMLGVAAIAAYVPAQRATQVDPVVALRTE